MVNLIQHLPIKYSITHIFILTFFSMFCSINLHLDFYKDPFRAYKNDPIHLQKKIFCLQKSNYQQYPTSLGFEIKYF